MVDHRMLFERQISLFEIAVARARNAANAGVATFGNRVKMLAIGAFLTGLGVE